MAVDKLLVPDIGDDGTVEVIDILIKKNQEVSEEETLIVLESDKATMEIPSDVAGVIKKIHIKKGDKVKTGSEIADIEVQDDKQKNIPNSSTTPEDNEKSQSLNTAKSEKTLYLPDLGTDEQVTVIEILSQESQSFQQDDSLLTLESDKASMDIPAECDGVIMQILVSKGQMVKSGDKFAIIQTQNGVDVKQETTQEEHSVQDQVVVAKETDNQSVDKTDNSFVNQGEVYAGPAARKLARQLGIDLSKCVGTGKNARILVEDVTAYAKSIIEKPSSQTGMSLQSRPVPDFSKFGPVTIKEMSRIKKKTAQNLQMTHMSVPPVTQFDKADITDLELFRQDNKKEIADQGGKLTMILFVMKALVATLKKFPQFNSSLSECGTQLIHKHYFHVGVAVDTPNGLVVPVVQNVDSKSILELSKDIVEISQAARKGQLKPAQMQGSSMTISSLGGIGGTAFTPIVNWPYVAILGLSAIQIEPVYNGTTFEPKKMLPLSLSYDHRVIDGAEAARFIVELKKNLEDLRRVLF